MPSELGNTLSRMRYCTCSYQCRGKKAMYVHLYASGIGHREVNANKPDKRKIEEAEEKHGIRTHIK